MVDWTTKVFLGLIAVALWGLLLKPVFTPVTVHAQGLPVQVEVVGMPTVLVVGPVDLMGPVEVTGEVEVDGVEGSGFQLHPIEVKVVD